MLLNISDTADALRVLSGLWFLPHIISKALNADKASLTFDRVGFRPGKLFLYLTLLMELVALVGMVFNIYPKLAALVGVSVLAGASYAVLRMNGFKWRWQLQGQEFLAFWALCCVLSVVDF